jgi:hypothetical protein
MCVCARRHTHLACSAHVSVLSVRARGGWEPFCRLSLSVHHDNDGRSFWLTQVRWNTAHVCTCVCRLQAHGRRPKERLLTLAYLLIAYFRPFSAACAVLTYWQTARTTAGMHV